MMFFSISKRSEFVRQLKNLFLCTPNNSAQQSYIHLSLPFSLSRSLSFFPLCIRRGFDKKTRIRRAEQKGLLAPVFLLQKVFNSFLQNAKGNQLPAAKSKKSEKIKVYFMRCSITLWQFAKMAQIPFFAVAKLLPFALLCIRNPRNACNADHALQYR